MPRFSNLSAPHLGASVRAKAAERLEELYSAVALNWPGFIEREGQITLMRKALEVFLSAKTETHASADGANFAALEAGTGTGKTIGYCLAAIVASEILNKKVIISTATVALQEQLFLKDLPLLASFVPELRYDLLKGRARYVCKTKLENAIGGEVMGDWLDMDYEADEHAEALNQPLKKQALDERTVVWLKEINKGLDKGAWDGEVDSLGSMADDADWRMVQADAHSCTGARCEHFKDCSFFTARRRAQGATLQVANHALVLATLNGESALIDAANCLFVFDEAHHLPDIAAEQFSYRTRIGHAKKALSALMFSMGRGNRLLPHVDRVDMVEIGSLVKHAQETVDLIEEYISSLALVSSEKPTHRFPHGVITKELGDECDQLAKLLSPLHAADLGPHLGRVLAQKNVFESWATNDNTPLAKWIDFVEAGEGRFDAVLCVSPMTGAQGLIKGLWRTVSAAVCTSATLSACGTFDFFERLSGLNRYSKRITGIMPSPFDYAKQGALHLPRFKNTPKSNAFSDELCKTLPEILSGHRLGQLALFTSRRQMDACYAALPVALKQRVLVQGSMSRQSILKQHRERVGNGESSIIFGLQSMGEGMDLPGALCEHVIIDKLPFTPPTSPVEEALSEWLSTQGRDAFNEIVVPRTSMRLAQWVGRGVRTVDDFARITICDTRLLQTSFGRRILNGLPPFSRV